MASLSNRACQVGQAFSTDPKPKETAANFSRRELDEVAQRMEAASNRIFSAVGRLRDHFGVPAPDLNAGKATNSPSHSGMDGLRARLDDIDSGLHAAADNLEELI